MTEEKQISIVFATIGSE